MTAPGGDSLEEAIALYQGDGWSLKHRDASQALLASLDGSAHVRLTVRSTSSASPLDEAITSHSGGGWTLEGKSEGQAVMAASGGSRRLFITAVPEGVLEEQSDSTQPSILAPAKHPEPRAKRVRISDDPSREPPGMEYVHGKSQAIAAESWRVMLSPALSDRRRRAVNKWVLGCGVAAAATVVLFALGAIGGGRVVSAAVAECVWFFVAWSFYRHDRKLESVTLLDGLLVLGVVTLRNVVGLLRSG